MALSRQNKISFTLLWILFIASQVLAVNVQTGNRNRACNLLVAIDVNTVFSSPPPPSDSVLTTVSGYMSSLNSIYQSSILKYPPNNKIYLRLQEIWLLNNFVPNCKNESVVLGQFSKLDTSGFCLAHLLTYRDFGCVVGLATVGGLCKRAGNTGFTKSRMQPADQNSTVTTMAHELGHNFGSDHDGGNSTAYSACNPKDGAYIMGGGGKEFSSCSIQAMQARLHAIIGDKKVFEDCFKSTDEGARSTILIKTKDLQDSGVDCPEYPRPVDEDCKDNPDPPEPPKPPPDPVCGNGVVEHPEECDCGPSHEECDDPCCYPATLSAEDVYLNSTAAPCTVYTHYPCNMPYWSPLLYGLLYSWVFLVILAILVGTVLILDWRNKKALYSHIIYHEEDIRINTEAKRNNVY